MSRLSKNGSQQRLTFYAGDYETVVEGGSSRSYSYIYGGDGLAAVYDGTTYYTAITDHLCSIVKLVDKDGNVKYNPAYDAWGNFRAENNSIGFHRGYCGHEHLKEFGLINMNGRMYDPLLSRFLSPDPYVQAPDFSQSFNRYSYCLNNPFRYTDPSGEFFDMVFRMFFFTSEYLTNLDDGYEKAWNNSGRVINAFCNGFQVSLGDNAAIGINPLNLGVYGVVGTENASVYAGYSLLGGFNYGANVNLEFDKLNVGLAIGGGNNHWGWNVSARYEDGWGLGYGKTYYGNAIGPDGQSNKQILGNVSLFWKGGSFRISNDLWGDGKDRWRTSAAELSIEDFSIGTYIYTNWGNVESEQIDPDGDHTNPNAKAPILGANKKGAWKNGQVYNAPFWIGYRNGNQISRIGFSHSMVQNLTQNAVHKYLTPTPYFLNYDYFNSGLYFYSGYYNPFSLWEK
jgi:RHS repeat-associated protein